MRKENSKLPVLRDDEGILRPEVVQEILDAEKEPKSSRVSLAQLLKKYGL